MLQIASSFIYYNQTGIEPIRYLGHLLWIISAILGWAPIITLKKHGGVPKGKSYINTTKLVTTGIYSIIRHPQYLAWYYVNLALILITQHQIPTILGILAIITAYKDIDRADKRCIEKFGEPYKQYMKTVPGYNLPLGIIRRIQRQTNPPS